MTRDTITALPDPTGFSADPLSDLIRSGARQLTEQALEAELGALLEQFSNETTPECHARVVRHGHLPERQALAGIGPVVVKLPRVRGRGRQAEKVRFRSALVPPYLCKAKFVEEGLPWPRSSAPTRLACHPQRFHGSKPVGGRIMNAGRNAISAPGVSCISGQTRPTSSQEWKKNNVFWF